VANISGFKGVSWWGRTGKWRARISIDGKSKTLGYFNSPERAFIAYMMAAWKHFDDFANVDCLLFVQYRRLKACKALERTVLWNLARPDPNYMAA
jgi:hypothetical protein